MLSAVYVGFLLVLICTPIILFFRKVLLPWLILS